MADKALKQEFTYDSINERVLIETAIAQEKQARGVLVRAVSSDEMLVPEHVVIWRALRAMVERNLEYDAEVMRQLVDDEGGRVEEQYLAELEANAQVASNLEYHLNRLRLDATRARLLQGPIPELVRAIQNPKASADNMRVVAQSVLRSLDMADGERRFLRRKDELARAYKAEVAARVAVGNFYSTGFPAMDKRLVEGAMPKRMVVIAGLPGSGKSTFTASLAMSLAQMKRRVLYGCWEMPSESMLDVMVAALTSSGSHVQRGEPPITLKQIVQGNLTPAEKARVDRATDYITSRITFMDNPFFSEKQKGKRSNERALDLFEAYLAESGCDVAVCDLWERMLADLSYDGVTTALYKQQDMFARYNVYGVLVQQLRLKDVEKRADKRPTREAIKGTGAFVEVADQIYGIYRVAQFKRVPDDCLEAICLKQRKGEANWAVRFTWRGELALVTGGEVAEYDPGLESGGPVEEGEGAIQTGGYKRKPSRRER